jgi:putative MATE family efflux protein
MRFWVNIKKNIELAWPLALNALLLQSMVMVDVILVSSLGEYSVAALGISTAITAFLIGVQFALANGTQMILARAVGRNDKTQCLIHFYAGLAINVSIAMVFSFLLFLVSHFALQHLSLHPSVAPLVSDYLTIMVFVLIASSVTQVIIVLFNAQSNTKTPLQGLFLELPVNISLSYCLINGVGHIPSFGVQGAAIGSLVAVCVRLMYLLFRLVKSDMKPEPTKVFQVTRDQVAEHLKDAAPIAANYITLSLGMMVFQLLFARLPVVEYAAIVLVLPWLRMGGQVSTAWAQATSIHISQLIGQGTVANLNRFSLHATRITFVLALILMLLYYGFTYFIPIVYPALQQETVDIIQRFAPLYIVLVFFRTINTTAGQALRAFGFSGYVLMTHTSTQWLAALPLCALLIYLDVPVFWVFSMLLFEELLKVFPFFYKFFNKLKR